MNKEKKQQLSEIKVQSFVTSLEKVEQRVVRGGSETEPIDRTSNPIFC